MDIPYTSVLKQMQWPATLAPSASNRLSILFQLEHSQWWPAETMRQAQFRQLKQVVPYAARHVPHYRRTLGRFTDADAVRPETWLQVPVLTRPEVFHAKQDLVSQQIPREHGATSPIKTSGSTGMMVELLGSELTHFFWRAFALREHYWHRRDFSQRLLAFRYVSNRESPVPEGQYENGWGDATDDVVQTGPAALYSIEREVSFLAERLLQERPGYLLTHPSVIAALIDHFERHGLKPEGLLELRSMGESLPEHLRETCASTWGVPLVDMYTCQEAGYLAVQCPEHPHYHVQAENVLLEVVGDDGRPCAPGEVGRVLITSLNNFATPLIRYELGDFAEVGGPCPCGRGLPVLTRVMGRYRSLLTLPSGARRWPTMGYEKLGGVVPAVQYMQMLQHSLDDIEVRLVMPRPLTAPEQQALTAYLHGKLGHPFPLRFSYVDTIRSGANGKIENFISKLQPAPR